MACCVGAQQQAVIHAKRSRSATRTRAMRTASNAQQCPWGSDSTFIGVDLGTSGARASVIDADGRLLSEASIKYRTSDLAAAWRAALFDALAGLDAGARARAAALAVDGTSSTMLLLSAADGAVLAPPELYNTAQPAEAVEFVHRIAPADHTATASTSSLCKVARWHQAGLWQAAQAEGRAPVVLDHASWVASLLHGVRTVSDWHNSLKMGYDPGEEVYPEWLAEHEFAHLLPATVVAPGWPVAQVTPEAAKVAGLPPSCWVCAGTTDSIAAFLAAGVTEVGEAVTSLGSTLAVKLLSRRRIDDARFGVYSHRLGDLWLVGGASNCGGAVLRQHFTDAQLAELSAAMDPSRPTGLDYYPLPAPGERFPTNDPSLLPRLEPRPESDALFLQAIFEGMAQVEARGYQLLEDMGADQLVCVLTAGGGGANPSWTAIRQLELGVPVRPSPHSEASFGAAMLARQGLSAAMAAGGLRLCP